MFIRVIRLEEFGAASVNSGQFFNGPRRLQLGSSMSPAKSGELCNVPLLCYLRSFGSAQESKRNKEDK